MTRTISPPTRFRFSRDDYHRMADAGILRREAPVELLDGEVVEMSPIRPFHSGVVDRLTAFFAPRVGDRAICRVQGAITLGDFSEPEPDFVLLRPRADFYTSGHPGPEDVLLVIEVADSSIEYDLNRKRRAYAEAGIPEYWVFDLLRCVLIVHRAPVDGVYTFIQEFQGSDRVSPVAFADLSLDVGWVLS